jgi:hypothetical protein
MDPRGCLEEAGSVSGDELEAHHGGKRLKLGDVGADPAHLTAVLGIRHIFVRIRIQLLSSVIAKNIFFFHFFFL